MQCGVPIHPCRIDLRSTVNEYVEHVDLTTPCCEVKRSRAALVGIIHLAVDINEKSNDVGVAEPSGPMQRSLVPVVPVLDADACAREDASGCQLQCALTDHGWGLHSEGAAAFRRSCKACYAKPSSTSHTCEHVRSKPRNGRTRHHRVIQIKKLHERVSAMRGCPDSGSLKLSTPPHGCAQEKACVVECFFHVNKVKYTYVLHSQRHALGQVQAGMSGAIRGLRHSPLSTSALALATSPFSAATCSSVHGMLLGVLLVAPPPDE